MTDLDGQFSAQRLADVAQFAADFMATSPDAQDVALGDIIESLVMGVENAAIESRYAPQEDLESAEYEFPDPPGGDDADFGRAAEATDDRYRWCERVFALLRSRSRELGSQYPFEVDSHAMRIWRCALTDERRAYVFYLCCSSLAYFSRSSMRRLTTIFEILSAEVLEAMLPSSVEIDIYGSSRSLATSRFTGTPYERLTQLAATLRGKVLVAAIDFNPRDSGDNGLDIVAWIPMADRAKGVPSFFAQCACGKGWEGKQYDASHERWREFIHLSSPSTKVTFVPHYYRKVSGEWYAESEVSGVVVDRLRALLLHSASSVVPKDLVDAVWEYRLAS